METIIDDDLSTRMINGSKYALIPEYFRDHLADIIAQEGEEQIEVVKTDEGKKEIRITSTSER